MRATSAVRRCQRSDVHIKASAKVGVDAPAFAVPMPYGGIFGNYRKKPLEDSEGGCEIIFFVKRLPILAGFILIKYIFCKKYYIQ